MGHSDIGPSSAERWMNCAGSVRLSRGLPRKRSSKYASWGTVAHGLGEELLTGKVDEMTLMLRIGEVVEDDGNEVTIDEEMVQVACGYAARAQAELAAARAVDKPAPVISLCEEKVSLPSVDPDLYGTLDWGLYRIGDFLTVRDLKTGQGKKVYAKENPQLGIYALAVAETKGINLNALDKVKLIVDAPRQGGEDVWEAPRDWLLAFKEKVAKAIEATRDPNAPLKAGEWCRWCRAVDECPELRAAASREAQADFTVAPAQAQRPSVEAMEPWKLGRLLDWEPVISAMFSSAYLRVQQLLEAGQEVPGYKLVEGRSNRRWTDKTGEEAARIFAAQYGDKVFTARKVLSVAQMETLVGKRAFAELAGRLVEKPEARRKVAPMADERPETGTSAQADFADAPPIIEGEVVHEVADPFLLPAPEPVTHKCDRCPQVFTSLVTLAEHACSTPVAAPAEDAFFAPVPEKRKPIWP